MFFFNFSAAHLPVRLDIETKSPYFLFLTWLSKIRNQEFRLYIYKYIYGTVGKHLGEID